MAAAIALAGDALYFLSGLRSTDHLSGMMMITSSTTGRCGSAAGLQAIWLHPTSLPQWYPMVHTTFWVEYQLWGLNPLGYKIDNLLLHFANAILLWIIIRKLKLPGAWLAAAVFALHPMNVESVAWVTERKNVLSGFFYLAALLTYLKLIPVSPSPGTPGEGRGGNNLELRTENLELKKAFFSLLTLTLSLQGEGISRMVLRIAVPFHPRSALQNRRLLAAGGDSADSLLSQWEDHAAAMDYDDSLLRHRHSRLAPLLSPLISKPAQVRS